MQRRADQMVVSASQETPPRTNARAHPRLLARGREANAAASSALRPSPVVLLLVPRRSGVLCRATASGAGGGRLPDRGSGPGWRLSPGCRPPGLTGAGASVAAAQRWAMSATRRPSSSPVWRSLSGGAWSGPWSLLLCAISPRKEASRLRSAGCRCRTASREVGRARSRSCRAGRRNRRVAAAYTACRRSSLRSW